MRRPYEGHLDTDDLMNMDIWSWVDAVNYRFPEDFRERMMLDDMDPDNEADVEKFLEYERESYYRDGWF